MFKVIFFIIANIVFFYLGYDWIKGNINYTSLIDNFQHIQSKTLIFSSIPFILSLFIYGARTSLLLKKPFSDSLFINLIGHGLNNIFPFRLGELIKIMIARKFYFIKVYELSLATILEKSFDLIIVSLLGLIVVSHFKDFNKIWLLIMLFLISVVVIFAIFKEFNFKKSIFNNSFLNSQFDIINNVITLLQLKKKIYLVFFYSSLIWILNILQYYIYFSGNLQGFGFSLIDAIVLVVITALTFIIPVTLGNIGLFEGVIVYYLKSQYSLSSEKALALACILHLLTAIPQLTGMITCIAFQFLKKTMGFFNGNKKGIIPIYNSDTH